MRIVTRPKLGFTLIELMVTVAVAAVLLSVAVPNLSVWILNNRIVAQINEFSRDINLARSEAVKLGSPVTICNSKNQKKCAGSWADGWIVFADTDNNGVRKSSPPSEPLVVIHEALAGGNTLTGAGRITFDANGFSNGFAGTWTLCDERGNEDARAVITSNNGQLRLAQDSNSDGIVEGDGNSNVTCP